MTDHDQSALGDSSEEWCDIQEALAGRFTLEREVGRGGMGVVYLARDLSLDRPLAIKVLHAKPGRDPILRERFFREARTAGGLSHPNIVSIHEVENQGDLVYFVMAYVEGRTLYRRVSLGGPLDWDDAERICRDVARALAYAHHHGVVHRDIKPENIIIEAETGRTFVTDFGIAKRTGDPTLTGSGELIGTPMYMSPEQVIHPTSLLVSPTGGSW